VIIVALVIGGIVVINQAFPAPGSSQAAGTAAIEDGPAVTASPTPSASPAGNEPTPSPTVVGTRIAVFNGAGVAGLAADTQAALVDEYGYIAAQEPADAPAPVAVTTIYFRAKKDKVEAEFLADDFFKKQNVEIIRLEQGVGDIDRSVQLAIYLGNDYAALTA
jgi:hypothetical protein